MLVYITATFQPQPSTIHAKCSSYALDAMLAVKNSLHITFVMILTITQIVKISK